MNFKNCLTFCVYLLTVISYSQNTISGSFTGHAAQTLILTGFKGLQAYTIDSVVIAENGRFLLHYPESYTGMGILSAGPQQSHVLALEPGGVQLQGVSLAEKASLLTEKGQENQWFVQYASEHARRDRTLTAWHYLQKIYTLDTLFGKHHVPAQSIAAEIARIKAEDSLYLAQLPDDSYVKWYLPFRSLISSVQTLAIQRTEEIPAAIKNFRAINYTDPRWQTSGLMKDAIEAHVWLIENSAGPLDSVYAEMQISIDLMIENLMTNGQKLNEITEHLFNFLEQRSLFTVSEYLALRLLNEKSCTLNNDFALQLESYRAMKKGNTTPDIVFTGDVFAPGYTGDHIPKKLSEVKGQYKVVVFGASWCPQCPGDLQSIAQNHATWKQYGVEVVFISLDEDKQAFTNFTKPFPFISFCDYKKWESPVVKNYHVFATPTIYLLNNQHEIILKPGSVSHLDAWVEWFLVKGNH